MDYKEQIINYLNNLSYLKRGHIKVVQVAKDTNYSMYQSSEVLEDLYHDGKLQKRYEVIDIDTALNYGCFKHRNDIPDEYVTDDGVELKIGYNGKIKIFYRYPNAHEKL